MIKRLTETIVTNAAAANLSNFRVAVYVSAIILVIFSTGYEGMAQHKPAGSKIVKKEMKKMKTVSGDFDVKTIPQKADNKEAETAKVGRMSLDKQFHGALNAKSTGEMLYAGGNSEESGVYVAIERVTGTLDGKTGSFVLYHTGVMNGGAYDLNVTVMPNSGTGDLEGITGKMKIIIDGGKHSYEFEYAIP